ncbi:MAG: hypothetical protein KGI25_04535 [Thaumarchaeota archaeon]|nr:hypothetical protein [Nitrososphaerota archaeon]
MNDWFNGLIYKSKPHGLSARNAKRLAKKLTKDVKHGRDSEHLGREVQAKEGEERNGSGL